MITPWQKILPLAYFLTALCLFPGSVQSNEPKVKQNPIEGKWPNGQWARHTIDDTSRGADGTRFGDVNGDRLIDITSPWEQGGVVRVYLNPGQAKLKEPWPYVTVGQVGDPEDSFFVDLDGDGHLDVVSACEGETKSMFIHWAPTDSALVSDSKAWSTEAFPTGKVPVRWMYGFAMQVDGKNGIDIVAASKGGGAVVGWYESPTDPRDMSDWEFHPLLAGRWFMTVRPSDMDHDGDMDLLATDRKGKRRGALWLENPGADKASGPWQEHRIGAIDDYEAMHNTIVDLDGDGLEDVLVGVKGSGIRYHRRVSQRPLTWETYVIEQPANTGGGKAVKVADIDLDGQLDVVVAGEHAIDGKIGTYWLSYEGSPMASKWTATSISGPEGFINDLLQLIDLDHDGDLDVVTVEEKGPYLSKGYKGKELGVIWYENPAR